MVTDGAEMQRVDHPGAPGAESVIAPADGRGPDAGSVGDAADAATGEARWGMGEVATIHAVSAATRLNLDSRLLRRLTRRDTARLRRSRGRSSPSPRGRTIGAAPMVGPPREVAWEATLRAVAHTQRHRRSRGELAFAVDVDELLGRKRVRPPDHLLMLVVDASGSMAGALTAVARQLAERALKSAYVERQRVAMIAFRAHGAELLFGPTNRVERARRALDRLPLGGATPLGRGLDLAHKTLRRAAVQDRSGYTTVLVISDGDTNVGNRRGYASAHLDVEQASRKLIALPDTEIILLDTTAVGGDERPARWVAGLLGARHIRLCET